MHAKSTYIAFSSLLTCCLALSLASCQNSSWHLAAMKEGGTVELCLSKRRRMPTGQRRIPQLDFRLPPGQHARQ
jgi:hypothetical protein